MKAEEHQREAAAAFEAQRQADIALLEKERQVKEAERIAQEEAKRNDEKLK